MSFEKIVRPFQTREITPPRFVMNPVTVQAQTGIEPVEIIIGKSPAVKVINGSETIDVTYYMKKWMKEKAVGQATSV
jgi:hypothetical protein